MQTILVTGHAGFIGSNLVKRLFREMKGGGTIVGIDNLNAYYDPGLKAYRLRELEKAQPAGIKYVSVKGSIADRDLVNRLFEEYRFDIVVNLAAQAGARDSVQHPDAYVESNVLGFYNILEACRHSYDCHSEQYDCHSEQYDCHSEQYDCHSEQYDCHSEQYGCHSEQYDCHSEQYDCHSGQYDCHSEQSEESSYQGVQHLVYASSSSVYGGNTKVPFSTEDKVDDPVSFYAATKKSNELFAHCYSHLYGIPTTGLRFFTVYGPAGRPDMAYFGFTDKLVRGESIRIFNFGNCRRDFTYIDDIVEGIVRVMGCPPGGLRGSDIPYAIYNIGGGQPENLLDFVQILQEELVAAGVLPQDYDFEAHKQLVPMQPGDVPVTFADSSALERDFSFTPQTPLREGLRKFAEWYKEYYG